MNQSAVDVRHLRKEFSLATGGFLRRKKTQVTAVDGISFEVGAGEAVAFIGPNGAGKSTTLKILTGILHPSAGEAWVFGKVPWLKRKELARFIGAVFGQRSQLWYHLPPSDTFELLARIYDLDRNDYRRRRDVLIERFALGRFLQTPVRKLSLGQRMRAEVAASLLHRPKILFLDEPTIGLDIIARQELRDLVREWNREEGMTVMLTSHDAGDIEHLASRVIVVNHGRIVVDDKVSSVRGQFLGEKVVDVKFTEAPREWALTGVTVERPGAYELKVRVNTQRAPLERVITQLLQLAPVADIAIENPPLEQVIARLYSQPQPKEPGV